MMKVRGFITHKKAEKYEDCQDYFAINKEKGRLAISDGMSQSIFPQWWAEELVRAYVHDDWVPDQNGLDRLRENWLKRVLGFLESQKQNGKPTWMLENCLIEKRGAGATFCGIRFKSESEWEGYVLGDSCLINIDINNSIVSVERSGEGEFNNNPDYFDSIIGGKGIVKIIHGTVENGTKLLLVTDALADFLYSMIGRESDYVHRLLQIESHGTFCSLIDEWRELENLHNDDTTLAIIEYDGSASMDIIIWDDFTELCNKHDDVVPNNAFDKTPKEDSAESWVEGFVQYIQQTSKRTQEKAVPIINELKSIIRRTKKNVKAP